MTNAEDLSAVREIPALGTLASAAAPQVWRSRRSIALLAAVAVAAVAAVIVPLQIQAADHEAAVTAHSEASEDYNSVVDGYIAGSGVLGSRYELAADQTDGFVGILRLVPDGYVDPVAAKQTYATAIETFKDTARVTLSASDETVPATVGIAPDASHAPRLPADSGTDEIRALTADLLDARDMYVAAADVNSIAVDAIDAAYDETVLQLDAMMLAGRTWGDRDVFSKDTAEQTAALIATAQALVKQEGETFVDLADRTTALQAFVAAAGAAQAGHDQTVAAEQEAARQAAAAEAERQAAAQRQQANSNPGSSSSRGSSGGQPGTNTKGSTGSIPQGGGRPGGGTNGTNGGCWTSNGAGGTMPCGG